MQNYLQILSISQSDPWAVIALGIRAGAYFAESDIKWHNTFSHSALSYVGHDGQEYIIDIRKRGARVKPLAQAYNSDNFSGKIIFNETPIQANPQVLQKLIEINSGMTYSVARAIKSQFKFFPYERKDDDSFCTDIVISGIERAAAEDALFPAQSDTYTPSECYRYVNNVLKYPITKTLRY